MVTVLVVDDDPVDRELVQIYLRRLEDVTLLEAPTLASGLEQADAADVVLLDLMLPDARAQHTIERWRAARPGSPPVIVLGGLLTDELREAAAAAGMGARSKDDLDRTWLAGVVDEHRPLS